jgi:ADP-ribose pyrophosphatase
MLPNGKYGFCLPMGKLGFCAPKKKRSTNKNIVKKNNTPSNQDKVVYKGHVTLVQRPYDGRLYDVVISKDAAIMLYIDEKDDVYFTKQFRPAVNRMMLELPAETLDKPGLSPLEVMMEGLIEECGIEIQTDQVKSLGYVFSTDGHDTEKVYLFLANGKGKEVGQKLEESEKIDVIKIPFEKAYKMAISGQLVGSKTQYLLSYEKLRRLGAIDNEN